MRILVPMDGSPASHNAAIKAIEIAKKDNSFVKLVNVFNVSAFTILDPIRYNKIIADLQAESEKMLEMAADDLDVGELQIEKEFLRGRPYEEIIKLAKKENFDLIVMGNRGFSKIKRFFVGSVTQRVISEAPCPVLVVQTEAQE